MPAKVVERWRRECEAWLRQRTKNLESRTELISAAEQREYKRLRDRLWHHALDSHHGECLLRQPHLAQIVKDTLLQFDGERYDLDSLVIMPNHVHLLVQFRPPTTLRRQTASWLRYSARRINEQSGYSGPFWQPEPFDHLIRSGEQFVYLRNYVRENPEKASLRAGEFLYWSRENHL
jgi:putative transposase